MKRPNDKLKSANGLQNLVLEAHPFVYHLGPFFREPPIQQNGTGLFRGFVYREVLCNHLGDNILQVRRRQLS